MNPKRRRCLGRRQCRLFSDLMGLLPTTGMQFVLQSSLVICSAGGPKEKGNGYTSVKTRRQVGAKKMEIDSESV